MPELTLGEKQRLFVKLVGRLIDHIYESGYEATFGEAYRTPEQAKLNAASGKGIKNSLHTDRLAIDLNLFKNGEFLTTTEAHRQFGEWWEVQNSLCTWGGHFNDANHYSVTHGGRK